MSHPLRINYSLRYVKNLKCCNENNVSNILFHKWHRKCKIQSSQCMSSQPRNGPDQILEATSYRSWQSDGTVKLQVKNTGRRAFEPISVPTLLKNAAIQHSDIPALLEKENGKWKSWNFKEYEEESRTAAKAFIRLGLDRFNGVCIMGIPSPEWYFTFYGSICAGGVASGIYTTSSPEACQYIAHHSRSNIVCVHDDELAQRFIKVLPKLPLVKAIVQFKGKPRSPGVMSWEDLMALGKEQPEDQLEERLKSIAINQCCSLIYTSGTTGHPKGVMCSHDNLTWSAKFYLDDTKEFGYDGKGGYVSYLPLNHIAGQLAITTATLSGGSTYCAEPDAMQGSLLNTLVEVQPVAFYSVPRLWEKMYEGAKLQISKLPKTKQTLAHWALKQGLNATRAKLENRKLSILEQMNYKIASKLVLNPVKHKLGLSKGHKMVSIAAPSRLEVMEFFMGLGIFLVEAYGLSETMTIATATIPKPGYFKLGTVGKPYDDMDVKLDYSAVDIEDEGEICVRGRSVCMGYLANEKATTDSIDEEAWLRTGDLGRFDKDGFLIMTGRLKELVITAGGENIPPVYIEDQVKKHVPIISNAMLIGDRRHYLTLLLTLKSETNLSTGQPLERLTDECQDIIKNLGSSATNVREARMEVNNDPEGPIATYIQQGIERYNQEDALSRAQKVQKWRLLPNDFSLVTEELNNTLKLKRSFVAEKYKDVIDEMYR